MSPDGSTVHIISSLGLGGAEAMLDKLTARGQRSGISVVCLTGNGPIGERIAGRGIPVRPMHLEGTLRDIQSMWRLFRYLRQTRPALVQTWLYHGDLVGGLVARAAGVRCVVWNIRNSGAALQRLSARTRAVVRVNGWLSHWVPMAILCCSEAACRNHVALGYARDKSSGSRPIQARAWPCEPSSVFPSGPSWSAWSRALTPRRTTVASSRRRPWSAASGPMFDLSWSARTSRAPTRC
jgi:hypothetical protein